LLLLKRKIKIKIRKRKKLHQRKKERFLHGLRKNHLKVIKTKIKRRKLV